MKFYFITKTLTRIKVHENVIKTIEENNDNCHGKDLRTSQITVKGKKPFMSNFSSGNLILQRYWTSFLYSPSWHQTPTYILPQFCHLLLNSNSILENRVKFSLPTPNQISLPLLIILIRSLSKTSYKFIELKIVANGIAVSLL